MRITKDELALINGLTTRDFTEDELFTFTVTLCDNDVDRDHEAFSVKALEKLAELFMGKTGIFDHSASAENQSARIYKTWVQTVPGKTTRTGEGYVELKAKAYMVQSKTNKDLILDIEGGIKKEVSVGCMARAKTCGICGANLKKKNCVHTMGQSYGGKLAYAILDNIGDAYEWSFVAVPAQPGAGVTKRYGGDAVSEVVDVAVDKRSTAPRNSAGTNPAGKSLLYPRGLTAADGDNGCYLI